MCYITNIPNQSQTEGYQNYSTRFIIPEQQPLFKPIQDKQSYENEENDSIHMNFDSTAFIRDNAPYFPWISSAANYEEKFPSYPLFQEKDEIESGYNNYSNQLSDNEESVYNNTIEDNIQFNQNEKYISYPKIEAAVQESNDGYESLMRYPENIPLFKTSISAFVQNQLSDFDSLEKPNVNLIHNQPDPQIYQQSFTFGSPEIIRFELGYQTQPQLYQTKITINNCTDQNEGESGSFPEKDTSYGIESTLYQSQSPVYQDTWGQLPVNCDLLSQSVEVSGSLSSPIHAEDTLHTRNEQQLEQNIVERIAKSNKKNVVKNIMSAFKRFISGLTPEDQDTVNRVPNFQKGETSPIQAFVNTLDIDTERENVLNLYNSSKSTSETFEEMNKKFKRYIQSKQFNHYTIQLLLQHANYGSIFEYFLANHALKWLQTSKVDDPKGHMIMVEFLSAAFQDISIIEKLKKHEKRKAICQ